MDWYTRLMIFLRRQAGLADPNSLASWGKFVLSSKWIILTQIYRMERVAEKSKDWPMVIQKCNTNHKIVCFHFINIWKLVGQSTQNILVHILIYRISWAGLHSPVFIHNICRYVYILFLFCLTPPFGNSWAGSHSPIYYFTCKRFHIFRKYCCLCIVHTKKCIEYKYISMFISAGIL